MLLCGEVDKAQHFAGPSRDGRAEGSSPSGWKQQSVGSREQYRAEGTSRLVPPGTGRA